MYKKKKILQSKTIEERIKRNKTNNRREEKENIVGWDWTSTSSDALHVVVDPYFPTSSSALLTDQLMLPLDAKMFVIKLTIL